MAKNTGKSAAKNAAATTGKQGIRKNKPDAYTYKEKKSRHPLLNAAMGGYAIHNTLVNIRVKKLSKKLENLNMESRLTFGPPDSFAKLVNMYERDAVERRLRKQERKQQLAARVGKMIGTALNMTRESGRTLAMKHAVSSSYGASNGIKRDDVTRTAAVVSMASMDDGQIEF